FAAIGTSGQVWPAAGFAQEAASAGAHCVEINLEASAVAGDFHEARQGRASCVVPEWVAGLVGEAGIQPP
ncbi:MAG: NAD-dependent protein deacylase, partial [Roseovarius sp.]